MKTQPAIKFYKGDEVRYRDGGKFAPPGNRQGQCKETEIVTHTEQDGYMVWLSSGLWAPSHSLELVEERKP